MLFPVLLAGLAPLVDARDADDSTRGGAPPTAAEARGVAFYEAEIRPLLIERCSRCHGPDKQKASLRLDGPAGLRAGSDSGPVLDLEHPEESRLLVAISYEDEDLQMPPKGRLDPREIGLLVEWVRSGAPMPESSGDAAPATGAAAPPAPEAGFDLAARADFWAYGPRREVAVPEVDPAREVLDPLDAFVAARLAEHGLERAPELDRRSYARRVTYDLTGLPPEPAAVEAFLADELPDATERFVDRQLASPAYAERWGRHWLDLVRYAETRGHEFDFPLENAWEYRNYVIRAFDADVPIDRLVREHIAGDLLEEPRRNPEKGFDESLLGTGFWFLGDEVHSPVDPRADLLDRVAGRIDTVSRAFLGLTVACARCHDHKFDAISTRDYYSLAGYAEGGGITQVRYETREANAEVARELEELRAARSADVTAALSGRLTTGHERLARYLASAAAVLGDEGPVPDGLEEPADVDLLFEDFEGPGWSWFPSGAAFGTGPLRADLAPAHQLPLREVGRALASSHQTRTGQTVGEADDHTGELLSPAFVIRRDFVHFLIGGGNHAETALELLVDGEVVRAKSGRNTDHVNPDSFDVAELRGRTARLRLVDHRKGGWGHVNLDQVVFSEAPRLELADYAKARRPGDAAERRYRVRRLARAEGLDASALAAWVEALDAAGHDESDPLHAYATLAALAGPGKVGEPGPHVIELVLRGLLQRDPGETDRDAVEVFDYGDPATPVYQNGFAFVRRAGGSLLLLADGTTELFERDGVWFDPTWSVLRPDPESDGPTGEVDWLQAGRTLRTPTFTLPASKLYYLVRGGGHAFACVDGHRMVNGPLHLSTPLDFADEGLRWVEHDLDHYVGHRLHVELSPDDAGHTLGVLAVWAGEAPPPPPRGGEEALLRALLERAPADLAALGEALARLALAGAGRLGRDTDPATLHLAGWLLARPALLEPGLVEDPATRVLARLEDESAELLARIEPLSRLAPAMLEATGIDEHVHARGDAHSPTDPAPRRFLEVFDGPEPAPIEAGSGRLGLADAVVSNPLFARVWANRLWHHLFGRGLVASTDDFGRMGELPTHPDLLEHLAARLEAHGFSTKAMLRELVLSRTYRTSSLPVAASLERDPSNRWIHHVPRRRMTAEAVRDAILFAAGTLDPSRGGKPVPMHLTEFTRGRGRPAESGPVDGDGRRSIYLAVRRNFPAPFLTVFDLPNPAATAGRRSVSNVPAQNLTLMNDPFVWEQAEHLAEATLAASDDGTERVCRLFERCLSRPPEPAEVEAALAFVAERVATVPEPAEGAEAPDETAEELAWRDLGHALFNLKEFLFVP